MPCRLPIHRKGEKIVLTWKEKNFQPQLCGSLGFSCLESPLFETKDSEWKIRLVPWSVGQSSLLSCSLMRVDKEDAQFACYLVESEICINATVFKEPEKKVCFHSSKSICICLIMLKDDRDEDKFPPENEMTAKIKLQRCFLQKSRSNYLSAVTKVFVKNSSHRYFLGDFLPVQHELEGKIEDNAVAEEEIIQNEEEEIIQNEEEEITQNEEEEIIQNAEEEIIQNAEEEIIQNAEEEIIQTAEEETIHTVTPSINRSIQTLLTYEEVSNEFLIIFEHEFSSLYLKCKFQLLDRRKNIVIASTNAKGSILDSERSSIKLRVPSDFLEEIDDISTVFETLEINLYSSHHFEDCKRNSIKQREVFFSSRRKKYVTLKENLAKLYYNGSMADFCIKAEEKIFQVHRSILAARSPVFKTMLNSDMLETRTGIVEITDMTSDVLNLFLKFIYTSELEENVGHQKVISLYKAAHKYDMTGLGKICRKMLIKSITSTNFDSLLILSHLHEDVILRQFIASFLEDWHMDKNVITQLLNITNFDKPLTEEDIITLEKIRDDFILMDKN